MRFCWLLLPLACGAPPVPAPASQPDSVTTVYVVRHAERASGEANADLSAAGLARAAALRDLAGASAISAVWVTEFCRTAQTADPIAFSSGLPLRVAPTGSRAGGLEACSPAIRSELLMRPEPTPPAVLARVILGEWRGRTVLVVGHSNTVPALVEALGAPSPCGSFLPPAPEECHLSEAAYGDVFVVRIPTGGTPTVEHLRIGG